jgi:glutamate 5-kinase
MRGWGHKVVLVTSGAVGLGRSEIKNALESTSRVRKTTEFTADLTKNKSICATIGQSTLMEKYKCEFRKYGIVVGQTLLAGRQDYKKELTRSTLAASIESGILQVINANDAVYDEQLKIGDNDTLSAEVARIIGADKLILVTDEAGFFKNYADKDRREFVNTVGSGEIGALYSHVDMGAGAKGGTGKMKTKLDAARIATKCADVYIVSNKEIGNLTDLVNGKGVRATHFLRTKKKALLSFLTKTKQAERT